MTYSEKTDGTLMVSLFIVPISSERILVGCDDVEGYHDDGGNDDDNYDGGDGDDGDEGGDGDDGGDQSNLQRAYLGRPWRQVRVTMTA